MSSLPLPVLRGACAHDCPDTCVWQVTVDNGRAVQLVGDPDHPFTRGTLCAKVNRYLERVYHPERILHPLRRTGPKGAGQFERLSWDEALAEVADRWNTIRAEFGAEAILPYSLAGNQGLIQFASLDRRLFARLGASQLERGLCGSVASAGLAATQGSPIGFDPEDLAQSRYIILWGTNTIVTNLHLWPVLERARSRGARLVVIDPLRTRTADAADWHLAPRPGSDAALALGLMHVIIHRQLVDRDYVERYSTGYEQLLEHVAQYSPPVVARWTGIAPVDIERLAVDYATTRPAAIRPLIGPEHHRNGAMIFRALACLPVLVGAWRDRGGGLCRSTGALQFSTLNVHSLTRPDLCPSAARTLNMRDLGQHLTDTNLAPPIQALCVYNSNPAVTTPNQAQVIRGLQRNDLFTIVHDLFLTETARYADLVFPATSQLEHLDLVPAWGHHYLALNRPAIEPLGESVSNTEFFRRLARALSFAEPWHHESDESLLQNALASGHPYLEGITYERLWRDGYAHLSLPVDWRPYAHGGFPTPSGRAELFSTTLAARGHDPLPTPGAIATPDRYPLQLISGKSLYFLNSTYNDTEPHRSRSGELTLWIHPDDAATRSLQTGDLTLVHNERGELAARCQVSDRTRPGVVAIPFGGATDAVGHRRSVNLLTPEAPTDWGGGSGFYDAFVEVRRYDVSPSDANHVSAPEIRAH